MLGKYLAEPSYILYQKRKSKQREGGREASGSGPSETPDPEIAGIFGLNLKRAVTGEVTGPFFNLSGGPVVLYLVSRRAKPSYRIPNHLQSIAAYANRPLITDPSMTWHRLSRGRGMP